MHKAFLLDSQPITKWKLKCNLHIITFRLHHSVFHIKPPKKWRFRCKLSQMLSKINMPLKRREKAIIITIFWHYWKWMLTNLEYIWTYCHFRQRVEFFNKIFQFRNWLVLHQIHNNELYMDFYNIAHPMEKISWYWIYTT